MGDNKRYGLRSIIIILVVVTFLTFFNALMNGFVSDDISGIEKNPLLGTYWPRPWAYPPSSVLFSALFALFGVNEPIFHLHSILWHIGVTILVYAFVFLLTRKRWIAFPAAFLFAVHPIHVENVTWVSGLPYLVSSFFLLLTLILFILISRKTLSPWWLGVCMLTTWLTFSSSEKGIVLPIILILFIICFSPWKRGFFLLLPVIGTMAFFAIRLFGRVSDRISSANPPFEGGTVIFNPLVQIPVALGTYLKLLIWPFGLTFYHENLSYSTMKLFPLYALGTTVFFLFMLIALLKKKKLLVFFGLLFLIGLSPTLLPVRISWVVAERYAYISSIGIFAVAAYFLEKLHQKNRRLFFGMFIALLIFYGSVTIRRNVDWTNEDTLSIATVKTSPASPLAQNTIGDYYVRHGDLSDALGAFSKAVELQPTYAEAIHNMANVYVLAGDATTAAQLYQKALGLNPTLVESAVNLAAISLQQRDYSSAFLYLKRAEQIDPNSPFVYNGWGVYYGQKGNRQKAIALFQKALHIDPENPEALKNLQYYSRMENGK